MTTSSNIPAPWRAPLAPLPTHYPLWRLWLPLAAFLAAWWGVVLAVVWGV